MWNADETSLLAASYPGFTLAVTATTPVFALVAGEDCSGWNIPSGIVRREEENREKKVRRGWA
ncbi:hypothetical protein SAMN06309945_2011 [Okibacterium fritillariae]|uniref:Uncharacterized protein n=1 Tax=Okibacterium fritillariae TaxID=123320 RepID=A0A1T5K8Z7_9MICO|nr:hypothetical protein SAMN06309945_2011 [Okibacterium fritillariae]